MNGWRSIDDLIEGEDERRGLPKIIEADRVPVHRTWTMDEESRQNISEAQRRRRAREASLDPDENLPSLA